MTGSALSKRESRERSAQLRALMREWDPIGVMADPAWPRDEYDCLVGPLLTLVQSGASREEITRYLRTEIVKHFGLSGEGYDFHEMTERVCRWFDRGWRNLAKPVIIFVALMDDRLTRACSRQRKERAAADALAGRWAAMERYDSQPRQTWRLNTVIADCLDNQGSTAYSGVAWEP